MINLDKTLLEPSDGRLPVGLTQFVLPRGQAFDRIVYLPEEVARAAEEVTEFGGRLTIEVLSNGRISVAVEGVLDGEEQDVAIKICPNEPGAIREAMILVVNTAKIALSVDRWEKGQRLRLRPIIQAALRSSGLATEDRIYVFDRIESGLVVVIFEEAEHFFGLLDLEPLDER